MPDIATLGGYLPAFFVPLKKQKFLYTEVLVFAFTVLQISKERSFRLLPLK